MTYFAPTRDNPSANTPPLSERPALLSGGVAPVQRRLIMLLWMWVCRLGNACDAGRGRQTRTILIAQMSILVIMVLLRGSLRDKTALLKHMLETNLAKRNARQTELYAVYLTWRQRKCWMWGGGFRSAALSRLTATGSLPASFNQETKSFEALIPD